MENLLVLNAIPATFLMPNPAQSFDLFHLTDFTFQAVRRASDLRSQKL